MVKIVFDEIVFLVAVIAVVISFRKWHVVRDRHLILTVIRNALLERKSLWAGILAAVFYLAIFMIFGGQGGRIHILFGRVIWNTSIAEVFTGILLAILVMLSMALFIYGVHVMGPKRSGTQGGIGLTGSLLALMAAFCP